ANIPPDGSVLSDVNFNNNTIVSAQPAGAHVNGLMSVFGVPPNVATPQINNLSFQNNIAPTLANGIFSSGGGTNNCAAIARPNTPVNMWNGCFTGASPFSGNVLMGSMPATVWPAGNSLVPDWPSVGFDDFLDGVYALPQASPYFGKGANVDLVNMATF